MILQRYKSHYGALVRLGTPLIIGQLGTLMQNFADTLMIGHHSTEELGAAAVVSNIYMLGILMASGFALCLTPLIGQHYAQDNTQEMGHVAKNGLMANTLAAMFFMTVYGVLYFFLDRLGQPEEIMTYVRSYYLINLTSLPFVCWMACIKQNFDATTDTKTPMWILLGGNALNILGNWVLIYGRLGLPELGIVGAGLSTLTARIVMCVVIAAIFFRSSRYAPVVRAFHEARLNPSTLKKITALATPISLQMGMESGAWSLASIIVGWIGTNALAGHQIMLTISQLFFQFYLAISAAVSIRVSLFLGQKRYDDIRLTSWAGSHLCLLVAALVAVPVWTFRQELGLLFTDSPEVASVVASAILPLIAYQLSDGFQCVMSNSLRGLAYVKPLMLVAFIAYFVTSLPLAYIFGLPIRGGLVGVWYSFPIGLTVAGVLYYHFYSKRMRQLMEQ